MNRKLLCNYYISLENEILCLGQNAVHKALDDDNAGVILVSQTQLMLAVNFGFYAAAVWIVKPNIHRGGVTKIRINVEVARLLGHAVVQPVGREFQWAQAGS